MRRQQIRRTPARRPRLLTVLAPPAPALRGRARRRESTAGKRQQRGGNSWLQLRGRHRIEIKVYRLSRSRLEGFGIGGVSLLDVGIEQVVARRAFEANRQVIARCQMRTVEAAIRGALQLD